MTTTISPVSLRPPELLVHAVSDGIRLGLQLHSLPGMGKEMARTGAWWLPGRRMWVVFMQDAQRCLAWLGSIYAGQHVELDGALDILRAALAAPEPDYFTQVLDVQIFRLINVDDRSKGHHAVSFSYDAPTVHAMRLLRGRFHKPGSAWQVPGDIDQLLRTLRDLAGIGPEFIFVHEQPVVLEDLASPGSEASPIQVPGAAPERGDVDPQAGEDGAGFLSAVLDGGAAPPVPEDVLARAAERAGLRAYQLAGVRHLVNQYGACLGDDMGLGKSRQTVVATRLAAGEGRVLILCPASLRINWEREIRMVYPDAVVGMAGEDRMATLYGCNWVIANYERLGAWCVSRIWSSR